jgi:hypothetical protein
MNRITKGLTVLVCVLLCVCGAFLSLKENAKSAEPKTQVAPVDNHEPNRAGWTWA